MKNDKLCKSVINANLTYLDEQALMDIMTVVKSVGSKKIVGSFLELGCALGGSAIIIASTKDRDRQFTIYDVFGMIPPPSTKDDKDIQERYKEITSGMSTGISGDIYYGYQKNLKKIVVNNFKKFHINPNNANVKLIEGLYEDTLHFKKEDRIAFAHIDCDWYDSVMTCLERITPILSVGGVLVIDDYYTWSGCKKAIDDYFLDKKASFNFITKSRLHITRVN